MEDTAIRLEAMRLALIHFQGITSETAIGIAAEIAAFIRNGTHTKKDEPK